MNKLKTKSFTYLLTIFIFGFSLISQETINAEDNSQLSASESQLIAPALIYFKSSQYQQAFEQFTNYLKKYPKGIYIEKAQFHLGRCRYEEAYSEKYTKEAMALFKHLIKTYPRGRYKPEAYFWLGKTYLKMANFTKDSAEKLKKYEIAMKQFNNILDKLPRGTLDFENRYIRAITLGLIGDSKTDYTKKQPIYQKTVRSFEMLITHYSNIEKIFKAKVKLIEYLYKARKYNAAIKKTKDFKKEFPDNQLLATVLFYQAESLYFSGRLKDAVDIYEESFKLSSKNLLDNKLEYNAKLGAAWSYFRLASAEKGIAKKKFLIPASTAFRRTLEKMPITDYRYKQTKYKLAECLIGLDEYREGLLVIKDLLNDKDFYINANYLAGKATNGIKDYVASRAHFKQAINAAIKKKYHNILLKTYLELANIEIETKNPANAYYLYKQALIVAKKLKNQISLAESQFGAARSLLAIGKIPSDDDGYAETFFKSFMQNLITGASNYKQIPSANLNIKDTYRACLLLQKNKIECLQSSLNIIKYETKSAEHIRFDELFYLKGRILLAIADSSASLLNIKSTSSKTTDSQGTYIENLYTKSLQSFKKSLSANPRGGYAAKTLLEIGRAQYNLGNILSEFAIKFNYQEQASFAQEYQQKSHRHLSEIPEYLLRIQSLESDQKTLLSSKHLLGNTYIALNMSGNAETIFRELLNEPRMPMDLRLDSASSLAKIIGHQNRNEEAINILKPYIKPNLSRKIILQAGRLYMKNNFYSKAIGIFKLINEYNLPKTKNERIIHASILLHLYKAELDSIAFQNEFVKNKNAITDTIKGLTALAEQYSETNSAAEAINTLGLYFIKEKEYQKAIDICNKGLNLFKNIEFRQEMLLLAAKTFMAIGDQEKSLGNKQKAYQYYRKAMASDRKVEIVKATNSRSNSFKARAIFGIARAHQKIGETDKAIGRYAFVFAHFPNNIELSDNSRIEASKIMISNKRYKQAYSILLGVIEKNKITELLKKVESMINKKDE